MALSARYEVHRALKACRVSRCKELFRVGTVAGAAELLRWDDADVEVAIERLGRSVSAAFGGRDRCVKDSHCRNLRGGDPSSLASSRENLLCDESVCRDSCERECEKQA